MKQESNKIHRADSNLIAAAPDLLAAAREALPMIDENFPGGQDAIDLLRAAIAKAEGGKRNENL